MEGASLVDIADRNNDEENQKGDASLPKIHRFNPIAAVERLDLTDYMDIDEASFYDLHIQTLMKDEKSLYENPNGIDEAERTKSLAWMIGVQLKYNLSDETLNRAVAIMDHFCSVRTVPTGEISSLCKGCLILAAKQLSPKVVDELKTNLQSHWMDESSLVLHGLGCKPSIPTISTFLNNFLRVIGPEKKVEELSHCLADLALFEYKLLTCYKPSLVAASCIYTAKSTLGQLWDHKERILTSYDEKTLKDCSLSLNRKAQTELPGVLDSPRVLDSGNIYSTSCLIQKHSQIKRATKVLSCKQSK